MNSREKTGNVRRPVVRGRKLYSKEPGLFKKIGAKIKGIFMYCSTESVRERVAKVMTFYPEARNDDSTLIRLYEKKHGKGIAHETITRRRRELQSKGLLIPDYDIYMRRQYLGRQKFINI